MDLHSLLKEMMVRGASDLHIVAGVPPVFRTDGNLKPLGEKSLTPEEAKSLIYSVISAEKIAKFEKTHELDFSFGLNGVGRFRTNVHFQRGSIAAAIRSLPDHVPSLSALNLPSILAELALKKRGLVLVTGPAGCGKSTTLAAMVEIINERRPAHIITVEDPVEYMHSHKKSVVEQREVGSDTFSFAESLKRCLRQDPDVILIGEMRDLETIAIAITVAETGHLVLATLHTPDAPGAVDRIIDVFPSHQQPQIRTQLSSTLQAIIAQLLLPKKSGRGRVPVVELLIASPAVRNLIRTGKSHQLPTVAEITATFYDTAGSTLTIGTTGIVDLEVGETRGYTIFYPGSDYEEVDQATAEVTSTEYDEEDTLLASSTTSTTDLEVGETWDFSISYPKEDYEKVDHVTAEVKDDSLDYPEETYDEGAEQVSRVTVEVGTLRGSSVMP